MISLNSFLINIPQIFYALVMNIINILFIIVLSPLTLYLKVMRAFRMTYCDI